MVRRALGLLVLALAAGCSGGNGGAASTSTVASASSSGAATGAAAGGEEAQRPRSGLAVHIQNMRAGGALPEVADPQFDALDVSFELQLVHSGTEPLTGINVARARLVHDDGREVVFGVLSEGWDGRLEPGATRVVAFRKTPDSATPRATRALCGQHMRVEVTLELAGRQARATSRRVPIECPRQGT
jgi:hypothetical protein